MTVITDIAELSVGEYVFIMQRGEYVGPFEVIAIGERTSDHAVMRSNSNTFGHYVPWNTWRSN